MTSNHNNSQQSRQSPPRSHSVSSFAAVRGQVGRTLRTKPAIIAVSLLVTIVVIGAGWFAWSAASTKDATTIDPSKSVERVSYPTITPNSVPAKDLGGWRRISPPENDPVYAYADTINQVAISVSQQPLPKSFKRDTNSHVAELAKKFSATEKITAGTVTAYLGTSAKGPQSLIFTKDNILILIKSQQKIATKDWVTYINSLN